MTAAKVRPSAGDEALAFIAEAIGEEAALALATAFGGIRLYVPCSIGEQHPISVALGSEAAARLAAWAGGGELDIPKQPARRARVLALHRRGALTIPQIALETCYTERHVYRLIAADQDDRQASLFDDDSLTFP